MIKLFKSSPFIFFVLMTPSVCLGEIKTLLTEPAGLLFEDDFSKNTLHSKFKVQQNTQWTIDSGVLVGKPAPKSYQASKPDHNGVAALISLELPKQDVILKLDVKFDEKALGGMVEFGHKVSKVSFNKKGISLQGGKTKDTEKSKVEANKWYKMTGEVKGNEIVVSIDGVRVFYVKDDALRNNKKSIVLRGAKQGTIYFDNISMYEAGDVISKWEATKAKVLKDRS